MKLDVTINNVETPSVTALDQLRPGDTARVLAVHGQRLHALRLMEMGLVRGTLVSMTRRAPLGDPLELCLRGYFLSIRGADARRIVVERLDRAPGEA